MMLEEILRRIEIFGECRIKVVSINTETLQGERFMY